MHNLRWLAILMGIAIIGITGFQLYWLKNNYEQEKRTLGIKTDVAFRETILRLQAFKLKLDGFNDDSSKGPVRIFMSKGGEKVKMRYGPREEIVSTVNVIRDRLNDSLGGDVKAGMIISMEKPDSFRNDHVRIDSLPFRARGHGGPRGRDQIFNLLYGVDSLQDSLKLSEVNDAYAKRLAKDNVDVPFTITRTSNAVNDDVDPEFNKVTVGFIRPVTFELKLGNTVPYLLRRLTQPILFSVFLLGITLLSFLLLYKNLLKQRRLAEQKNEFISNITHELKTPIATVGVAIEALKNFNAMDDPERTREYLEISQNELQRLGLLVDKVLKLSMFEKKALELKKEKFDCLQLMQEILNTMKLQFEKYHARITLDTSGDNFIIEADKLHVTSVMYNLLDNALKYSKENPLINVRLVSHPDSIELSVTDNGIGIPAVYKEKIFEKFFRIPTGDKHNIKGYGLGLSYVSEVIKRHRGQVSVESEPGKGSTFTATFPTLNSEF
jgi:two-component system phosphate regulon sensor histidine kinase PhoR